MGYMDYAPNGVEERFSEVPQLTWCPVAHTFLQRGVRCSSYVPRECRVRGRDRYLPPLLDLGPLPNQNYLPPGSKILSEEWAGRGASVPTLSERRRLWTHGKARVGKEEGTTRSLRA